MNAQAEGCVKGVVGELARLRTEAQIVLPVESHLQFRVLLALAPLPVCGRNAERHRRVLDGSIRLARQRMVAEAASDIAERLQKLGVQSHRSIPRQWPATRSERAHAPGGRVVVSERPTRPAEVLPVDGHFKSDVRSTSDERTSIRWHSAHQRAPPGATLPQAVAVGQVGSYTG